MICLFPLTLITPELHLCWQAGGGQFTGSPVMVWLVSCIHCPNSLIPCGFCKRSFALLLTTQSLLWGVTHPGFIDLHRLRKNENPEILSYAVWDQQEAWAGRHKAYVFRYEILWLSSMQEEALTLEVLGLVTGMRKKLGHHVFFLH